MPDRNQTSNMALFCDFENIAIGVRDAKYDDLDIIPGCSNACCSRAASWSRRAYADWERYKTFKRGMHEAAFELIDIPHVRQSGKNSADIRLVVDALDLCYTKSHVDTFVIISGDSDFSPLVSKLRENDKMVVGLGVRNSTSDLLLANCDEFIFYDDLVREREARKKKRRQGRTKKKTNGKAATKVEEEDRTQEALDLVLETVEALIRERGENETLWGSMVKQGPAPARPGLQRERLRFSLLQPAAGGGEHAPAARAGSRREVGRLRDQVHAARRLKSGKRRQGGPAAEGAARGGAGPYRRLRVQRSDRPLLHHPRGLRGGRLLHVASRELAARPPRHLPAQLPPPPGAYRENAPVYVLGRGRA